MLVLLAGLVISLRTKDGTLVVTVNEPDAEVQVLNEEGKVEITRKGEKGPITISVVPGKHRLKVQKDGFELFTEELRDRSRGASSRSRRSWCRWKRTGGGWGRRNRLAFETPGFEKWVKEVAGMPAEEQVEAVGKKLMELNPGFDGKVRRTKIEDGVVTELQFCDGQRDGHFAGAGIDGLEDV